MAKKSRIEKNNKRIRMAAQYATKRAELKEAIRNPHSSWEEKEEAKVKLQKLPRNSNPTRIRNRCFLTGRPRGFYRKFGLARNMVRLKALEGLLPGVTKASW
jgi:small subunit ribosomal protein S14